MKLFQIKFKNNYETEKQVTPITARMTYLYKHIPAVRFLFSGNSTGRVEDLPQGWEGSPFPLCTPTGTQALREANPQPKQCRLCSSLGGAPGCVWGRESEVPPTVRREASPHPASSAGSAHIGSPHALQQLASQQFPGPGQQSREGHASGGCSPLPLP